jgi:hypothetical protein
MAFARDSIFHNFEELINAKKAFENETNQQFGIGNGTSTTPVGDPLRERFRYKCIYYRCTHFGSYRTSVKEGSTRERPNVTSKKTGCTAQFYVGLKKTKEGRVLMIKSEIPTAKDHSHPVSAELYNFHPNIRSLTDQEEKQALEMRLLGTTSGVMSQAINAKRRIPVFPVPERFADTGKHDNK